MKMHVLDGGRLRMRKSIFYPDARAQEFVELPVSAFLLWHPQGNVLFDSGCHPSVAEQAEERWGGLSKVMTPISKPGENIVTGLRGLDLDVDDIDVVVASHLHPDHCGCNAFFKRATIVCHSAEVAAAKAPGSEKQGYLKIDWDPLRPFDEIEGQRDLFGDDRIVLIPLPGHTPGTTGALVSFERSGSFLLASDSLSMRDFLDRNIIPKNTWDKTRFAQSLEEIKHIETRGATIVCGHDDAQWARLKKGADAYD